MAQAGPGRRANTPRGQHRRRCGSRVTGCSSQPAATSGSTDAGRADPGRLLMSRMHRAWFVLPALVALAGCVRDEEPQPRTTQVIVQPPAQPPQVTAMLAPSPPPPPQSELVPPPPPGSGPVVWQPGQI